MMKYKNIIKSKNNFDIDYDFDNINNLGCIDNMTSFDELNNAQQMVFMHFIVNFIIKNISFKVINERMYHIMKQYKSDYLKQLKNNIFKYNLHTKIFIVKRTRYVWIYKQIPLTNTLNKFVVYTKREIINNFAPLLFDIELDEPDLENF